MECPRGDKWSGREIRRNNEAGKKTFETEVERSELYIFYVFIVGQSDYEKVQLYLGNMRIDLCENKVCMSTALSRLQS